MAAQTVAVRFAPSERPRVAVAADGSLAAIHEPARIVIAEVPSCAAFAELPSSAGASDTDVVWVGTPPRLLVLSRFAAHAIVQLVDPFGPRTMAELRLDAPMRLVAAVGSDALAVRAQRAVILATTDRGITANAFPARSIPTAAGAAGTQLVVALPGIVEEWDPQSRLPKRRLKLPRVTQVTRVGGSDRVVWVTTQDQPARIDVLPLVNRGQPKVHELPEPIAHVASHPRNDVIACIGATSGRVFVIDLDGRAALRSIEPDGLERAEAIGLVVGGVAGVLAAQAGRPLAVVSLDDAEAEAPVKADVESAHTDAPPTTVTPAPATVQPRAEHGAARSDVAAFRERAASSRASTVEPVPALWADAAPAWREDLAAWARVLIERREPISPAAPAALPIDALVTRYELTPPLGGALALLYGAYLLGDRGVAPLAMARVAGWPDALGRGELAAKQVVIYRDARIELAPAVRRVLDELPPSTGTLVGTPGIVSLLGPCVLVAAGPLHIVAEACLSSIGGAILAAREASRDDDDPHVLVAEARAYGAVPMFRVRTGVLAQLPVDQPLILVADDDRMANELGLPRLR